MYICKHSRSEENVVLKEEGRQKWWPILRTISARSCHSWQLTVLFQVSFLYRRCLCVRRTWDLPSYITDKNLWNVAIIPAWKETIFVPEHCNICPAVCTYVCVYVCVSICTNWQRDVLVYSGRSNWHVKMLYGAHVQVTRYSLLSEWRQLVLLQNV